MKELIKFEEIYEIFKNIFDSYDSVLNNSALRSGITLEEAKALINLYFVKELKRNIAFSNSDYKNIEQLAKKDLVIEASDNSADSNYNITGRGGIICKYILSSQQKYLNSLLLNINEGKLNILNEIIAQLGNNTQ